MAALTHLDTHVLVWLYVPRLDLLSDRAAATIEERDLSISPIVLLELEFLREIGRLRVGAREVFQSLHAQLGLRVAGEEFPRVVEAALSQEWTRDPFDRLIVAQAASAASDLLTRDETILEHYGRAIW